MKITTMPTAERLAALDLTEREARIFWSMIAEPGEEYVHEWCAPGEYAVGIRRLATLVGSDQRTNPTVAQWLSRFKPDLLREVLRKAFVHDLGYVIPGDDEWPWKVERPSEKSFGLWTKGDESLLADEKKIAIVGARAATGYGEHVTQEITSDLVNRGGVTIVSGAAYGIDGVAHRAALASGGRTIAVLAGGLDRYYPAGHEALLTRITEVGLVISELPPGAPPTRWRFLQRNRIIAALSDSLLVVEAGLRSGSLNAAAHAGRVGVLVGAVPGPVTSAASGGTHHLIQSRAAELITNATDLHDLTYGKDETHG